MRLFFLVIFLNPFFLSSFAQTKKPAENKWCTAFSVEKIVMGIDTNTILLFPDTVSTFFVTISNKCNDCKINGPDYCLLSVLDFNADTLGTVAINGVPRKFNETRTYPAFARTKFNKSPDVTKLIIVLPPYCDNLKLLK